MTEPAVATRTIPPGWRDRTVHGRRWVLWVLCGALIVGAAVAGMQLRRLTWKQTGAIRYTGDIINGFFWGREVSQEGERRSGGPPANAREEWVQFFRGYWGLYDTVHGWEPGGEYNLDYPPLRLLVMSLWVKHVRTGNPQVEKGQPKYIKPLRRFNTFCEVAAAIAMFLLVRHWVLRTQRFRPEEELEGWEVLGVQMYPVDRGWMCGLLAGMLLWFNPAIILTSHGWPQWDVWLIPFFLLAALMASKEQWFWCGALVGCGGMLKGQILMVAPLFVMWPLFQKRLRPAAATVAGLLAAVALVTAPWLLRGGGWMWALSVGLAAVALFPREGRPLPRWVASMIAFPLVCWPLLNGAMPGAVVAAMLVAGVLAVALVWRRHGWLWLAWVAVVTLYAAPHIFDGSYAWLKVGYLYGARHYPYMVMGQTNNFPWILAARGWELNDLVAGPVKLKLALRVAYFAALAVCAFAAARCAARNDARVLVAIAAPWILMFTLLGQMHERYLLWGAGVTAVAAGLSVSLVLLHLLVSAVAAGMIAHVMLHKNPAFAPQALEFLDETRWVSAWLVLIAATLYLVAVARRIPRPRVVAWQQRRPFAFPRLLCAARRDGRGAPFRQ